MEILKCALCQNAKMRPNTAPDFADFLRDLHFCASPRSLFQMFQRVISGICVIQMKLNAFWKKGVDQGSERWPASRSFIYHHSKPLQIAQFQTCATVGSALYKFHNFPKILFCLDGVLCIFWLFICPWVKRAARFIRQIRDVTQTGHPKPEYEIETLAIKLVALMSLSRSLFVYLCGLSSLCWQQALSYITWNSI